MSDPQPNSDAPQPIVRKQERVVPYWEYETAYSGGGYRWRIPTKLFDRLCEWARQEGRAIDDFIPELLERAVRERAEASGSRGPLSG